MTDDVNVKIDESEVYPVYSIDFASYGTTSVDVPADVFMRWIRVQQEWTRVQDEMKMYVKQARLFGAARTTKKAPEGA